MFLFCILEKVSLAFSVSALDKNVIEFIKSIEVLTQEQILGFLHKCISLW